MRIDLSGFSLSGKSHPEHFKDILLLEIDPIVGNASRIILSDVLSLYNPSL
jgi:hypothetical protein